MARARVIAVVALGIVSGFVLHAVSSATGTLDWVRPLLFGAAAVVVIAAVVRSRQRTAHDPTG